MPPIISTIILSRFFARRQRMQCQRITNSLTPPTSLPLLASSPRRVSSRSGSARLGRSQKDGLPSRSWGNLTYLRVQGHQLALGGQPGRCPFQSETEMYTKARDLTLLAALSMFCAMVTWAADRDVLGSGFFALSMAAIWGAALPRRR